MDTKSKRKASFDAKRAARLEEKGVRIDTINPTQVAIGLEGYEEGGANCTLCDHDIKWLYTLDLGILGQHGSVGFAPVGSSCIRTWADSLPHSEAQQAILATLKLAEEEAERVKASFREFNRQVEGGKITEFERDALVRFLSSPRVVRTNTFLRDVAEKVEKFGGFYSPTQRHAFIRALNECLVKAGRKALPVEAATLPSNLSPVDRPLVERAQKVLADEKALAKLSETDRDALRDIYAKTIRYARFATDRQRGYFASIIKRADGGSDRRPAVTGQVEARSVVEKGADGVQRVVGGFGFVGDVGVGAKSRAFPATQPGQGHPNEDRNNIGTGPEEYDDLPL